MPPTTPKTMMICRTPRPTMDMLVNSKSSPGKNIQASTKRCTAKSNLPPMNPERAPIRTPTTTLRVVVVRHALRNALIPVVTLLGIQLPVLVAGVVILEQIFNLPGIGRFLVSSALTRVYPVISAITVIVAVFVIFTNLGIDLLYGYLDPRIRYS